MHFVAILSRPATTTNRVGGGVRGGGVDRMEEGTWEVVQMRAKSKQRRRRRTKEGTWEETEERQEEVEEG